MIDNTSQRSEALEIRELSLDEIDETAGAGLLHWIKCLFGGCGPKEQPRGPFKGDPVK